MDAHIGTGTYERLKFNPRNQERIYLPWSKKEVCAIFRKFVLDYREMMNLYMKGTGSGEGNLVAYYAWGQHDI